MRKWEAALKQNYLEIRMIAAKWVEGEEKVEQLIKGNVHLERSNGSDDKLRVTISTRSNIK